MQNVEQAVIKLILSRFPHVPTYGQREACAVMAHFLYAENTRSAMMLRGYAGTGKTSLISSLIATLPQLRVSSLLLAPTGRAAKVLSSYSHRPAFTIHKKIYRTAVDATGRIRTTLAENKHSHTLFIVDEASMIGLDPSASGRSLLEDLVDYVYSGNHCRLMLIGDTAQLPPVGQVESPALDSQFLTYAYHLEIMEAVLTEVVRQRDLSGILAQATVIRQQITELQHFDQASLPILHAAPDVVRLNGAELQETLFKEYENEKLEDVVIITRSNKRAVLFNRGVRTSILFREEEVNAGDYLMVVKNNYFWTDSDSTIGFIANGDIAMVESVRNIEDIYGFRFADASLRFVDYPSEPSHDCKLLLTTLYSESPSLTSDEQQRLYSTIMEDYADLPHKADRIAELRRNPYYNALQVKFSYALTCHKTQGGQWRTVIVDKGFLPPDTPIDRDYLRWLYTAATRATERLYLLDFDESFWSLAN